MSPPRARELWKALVDNGLIAVPVADPLDLHADAGVRLAAGEGASERSGRGPRAGM